MQQSSVFEREISTRFLLGVMGTLLVLLAAVLVVLVSVLTGVPPAALIGRMLNTLFASDSVQALWYVTRAAGLVAYILLWLSTAWGLVIPSKFFDPWLPGALAYDLHEFLSLLSIGFVALHILVLLGDRYLSFSVAAILVPFAAPYRPVWVGVGVIGMYLTLLVSVTFYVRRHIGVAAFRAIHLASFGAYVAAVLHGLMAGTDSPLAVTRLMYVGTSLVVVFLTVYWIMLLALKRLAPAPVRSVNRS